MTDSIISANLKELSLQLPSLPTPIASYLPAQRAGDLLFISGQLPRDEKGSLITGKLGQDCSLDTAQEAARRCMLYILAVTYQAIDQDWSKLRQVVRLGGFVNSTPDFTDHAQVINGASELLVSLMGNAGEHARAAVGVSSLPLGVCVEIDAIIAIHPS